MSVSSFFNLSTAYIVALLIIVAATFCVLFVD